MHIPVEVGDGDDVGEGVGDGAGGL
jgi:hypothetical protein